MNLLHYIKGNRKGKDARRLELEAMRDSFLHDAIEGYNAVQGNHADAVSRLQKNVLNRTGRKKQFPVWAAAACLALLLGVGTYFLLPKKDADVFISHEITHTKDAAIEDRTTEMRAESLQQESASMESADFEDKAVSVASAETKDEKSIAFVPPKEYAEIAADEMMVESEIAAMSDDIAVDEEHKYAKLAESKAYIPSPTTPIYDMGTENSISVRNAKRKEMEKVVAAPKADIASSKITQSQSSQKVLKGKVVDAQGEPVIGAIVQQKSTGAGVVTDMDGNFALRVDSLLNDAIAVSSIGYASQQMKVNHLDNNLLIAMHEDNATLDEVVISGYAKKKEVSTVKSKPEPVIGIAAYKNYLKNNITQPTDDKCADAKGKVILSFHVNENGDPYDIKVKKSLCSSADAIAIGLLRNGGKWTYSTQAAEIEVTFKGK